MCFLARDSPPGETERHHDGNDKHENPVAVLAVVDGERRQEEHRTEHEDDDPLHTVLSVEAGLVVGPPGEVDGPEHDRVRRKDRPEEDEHPHPQMLRIGGRHAFGEKRQVQDACEPGAQDEERPRQRELHDEEQQDGNRQGEFAEYHHPAEQLVVAIHDVVVKPRHELANLRVRVVRTLLGFRLSALDEPGDAGTGVRAGPGIRPPFLPASLVQAVTGHHGREDRDEVDEYSQPSSRFFTCVHGFLH